MKFGIFYEHQLPRPWKEGDELKLYQEALDQVKVPAKVIGEPVLFDVFFTREEIYDYRTSIRGDREMLKRFNGLMLENGILKGNTKFYFSTEHDQSDIQATIKGFQAASARLSDELV